MWRDQKQDFLKKRDTFSTLSFNPKLLIVHMIQSFKGN